MIVSKLLQSSGRFGQQRTLVIGEGILDCYLQGTSGRLCREAPVPIVAVASETHSAGGAANTAVNVHALGGKVELLSVIGDDEPGRQLARAVADQGVSTDGLIVDPGRETLAKHRVFADAQLLVRFDRGSTEPLSAVAESRLIRQIDERFGRADAVIVSDYGYGILTPAVIEALGRLQAAQPRLLVVDAKKPKRYHTVGVTAVKPNYEEALQLLKIAGEEELSARVEQMAAYEQRLLALTGAQIVAVTLDGEGALFFEAGAPPYRTYARRRPNSRATGAGDTFVSALTLALASGAHTATAAELASAAAGVVVDKDGTSSCSRDELLAALIGPEKFVGQVSVLEDRLNAYREQGKGVIFTNGCFDILHRGHITYLSRAKALGDVLIVGLNGDDSVRRLKGPERPINGLDDRAQVLGALSCVDHIVPFDEDTPHNLIRAIRPDVFVKGGDYTRATLPEAELVESLGGAVHILPYLEDFSTSGLIEKILQGNGDGRQKNRPAPSALVGVPGR